MTIWNDNAAAFAFTADQQVDHHRRAGIRDAIAQLRAGDADQAHQVLVRSVERQNRIAGNGSIRVEEAAR